MAGEAQQGFSCTSLWICSDWEDWHFPNHWCLEVLTDGMTESFFLEKKVRHEFDEVAFCWLFWWLLISSCYWFDCELKTNRNSIKNMNWRCQQHVCRGPPCHSCCSELRLPLVRRWSKAHSNVFSALWLQYGDETTTCPLLRISLVNQLALWIHKWKVHEWILDVYIIIYILMCKFIMYSGLAPIQTLRTPKAQHIPIMACGFRFPQDFLKPESKRRFRRCSSGNSPHLWVFATSTLWTDSAICE